MDDQISFRYDTQLLIEGKGLDADSIIKNLSFHVRGDSMLVVGDENLIKIHYHTNEPWKVLKYCSTLGEIFDIVVEDMIRQSSGKQG
jgi:dihydroxyacetone kinase-like predicted kinase